MVTANRGENIVEQGADWGRVGAEVRAGRIKAGYRSQEAAAEAAHISISAWRNIEGGAREEPRRVTLEAVCRVLGWPEDTLTRLAAGEPLEEILNQTLRRIAELEARVGQIEETLRRLERRQPRRTPKGDGDSAR